MWNSSNRFAKIFNAKGGDRDMAVLEKALAEEYERVQVKLQQIDSELADLPKGYISEKKIKDRTYYYLQRREKTKVVSEYIKVDEVAQMRRMIAYRKELEGERKDLLKEFDRVRKILGIYTESEIQEKIMAGLKDIEQGRVHKFEDVVAEVREEIRDVERIRTSNYRKCKTMD